MNILYIVPNTPTRIRVRPYSLVRCLTRRGHKVTLATLWETPAERQALDEWQAQGVRVIAASLSRTRKAWNLARTLPTSLPLQAAYCWQPALARRVQSALDPQFDVIHVEHLRGACYGLHLKSLIPNLQYPIPIVWDSVDCISYLFEQSSRFGRGFFARVITRLELPRTRRYEGWLVRQFDRVLVTSPVDRQALEQLSPQSLIPNPQSLMPNPQSPIPNPQSPIPNLQPPITVLPNGVDLDYFTPGAEARQAETLVFSGKMSYHANAAAALYLAEQVMPLVWARRPNVRLVIVGSSPPAKVRHLARSYPAQVEVTGYLPDIRAPLRQASLAVAPLLYGAGIQNKVLEAMACGTPVVASTRAVMALSAQPGADCLVADTPQVFAGEILRLLDDEALRRQLGAAGRRYVETHHNWNGITAQLEVVYAGASSSNPGLRSVAA